MSRRSNAILAATALVLTLAADSRAQVRPSDEQLAALRTVQTARISLSEDYGPATKVHLPFREVTGRLLTYAGVRGIESIEEAVDLEIEIDVTGVPKQRTYHGVGGGKSYTGAEISGTILLRAKEATPYRKKFAGMERPKDIVSKLVSDPSAAPFDRTFAAAGSYVPKLIEILLEVYGDELLSSLTRDQDATVRLATLDVAFETERKLEFEILSRLASDSDPRVRERAAKGLGGTGDPRAIPILTQLVQTAKKKSREQEAAVTGLRNLGADAIPALLDLLRDNDEWIRYLAANSLSRMKDPRIFEPLIETLAEDPMRNVRERAVLALGSLGDPRAVEPILEAWIEGRERIYSERSLKQLTGEDLGKDPQVWLGWWRQKRGE